MKRITKKTKSIQINTSKELDNLLGSVGYVVLCKKKNTVELFPIHKLPVKDSFAYTRVSPVNLEEYIDHFSFDNLMENYELFLIGCCDLI